MRAEYSLSKQSVICTACGKGFWFLVMAEPDDGVVSSGNVSICDLPDELLQSILLLAAAHRLDLSYYKLSTVCRSFRRILANESLKLDVVRLHHQSGDLLAQLESWPGAPDLERLLVSFLTANTEELAHTATAPAPSLLDFAVAHGFLDLARLLLTHGADPNRIDPFNVDLEDKRSTVWAALERDDLAMLRLLMDFGAYNPGTGKRNGHQAARSAAAHRILLEVDYYGPLRALGPKKVFKAGFERGDVDTVRLALALGVEPDDHSTGMMMVMTGAKARFELSLRRRLVACGRLVLDAGFGGEELLSGISLLEGKISANWPLPE
ncbi:hypothetical protein DFJ73DRAFT_820232 [Zopfochytrium polystomum]|nr:hypothetical protein DFJ73DRAFT_820232 [Zopfochytrium polystomum]